MHYLSRLPKFPKLNVSAYMVRLSFHLVQVSGQQHACACACPCSTGISGISTLLKLQCLAEYFSRLTENVAEM